MALIKCPGCAHDVSPGALACPQCGCPIAPAKKRARGIPTGCGIVIIVLATFWIIGAILSDNSGSSSNDSSTSSTNVSRPIQTYTAAHLYSMFHANEIKARQTLGNAIVRFTGVVASIQKSDFSNTPELQIRANCFNPYDCEDPDAWNTFEADLRTSELTAAASLTKGQTITLQCNKVSMPLEVYAQGCIIVGNVKHRAP